MPWVQQLADVSVHVADFLRFKDMFGARRVNSASSKARLVPDVSNRRVQGTFGGPALGLDLVLDVGVFVHAAVARGHQTSGRR